MSRLFVALKIPGNIIDKIIQLRNEAAGNHRNLKWEKEGKIHLTLKFIGNINEDLTAKIAESLLVIENYSSFDFTLTKFGFFFKNCDPKVLWIGLSNNDSLNIFINKIEDKLQDFGIQKEKRKFKPHLTLLRIKNKIDKNFVNNFENFKLPFLSFEANEISLIKSDLLPNSSMYTEIKNYKLNIN